MNFILNGTQTTFDGDPDLPLLTYLREVVGITSAKDGCMPQAACGCCTVQINGKGTLACITPMKKLEGAMIITTEGLGEFRQQVFANSFVNCGGVQCGYCIPGMVMQANALIDKNPDPSRDEIATALHPNLCRCTGYVKIVDAIQTAAKAIRTEEEVPLKENDGHVGSDHPKYDSARVVLGQRAFVDDIRLPGTLHGALRFSDHPRAKVLSIDTTAASALPGVKRVITAADVPGDRTVGLIYQDWPQYIAVGETTHYVGDVLACVVAESEPVARTAAELIKVNYDVLEPILDAHKAILPDSPIVNEYHPANNILTRSAVKRGDVDKARAESAFVVSGVYQTQWIEHGFMEPESAIGYPGMSDWVSVESAGVKATDSSAVPSITVLSQGQGVYEDRKQIAKLLGLPEPQVRVILVPNGGGFGGKEDLTVQGHAALAAYLLGAPVKVKLTRDESIMMHPKRHPVWMNYEIGCDANGKFTFTKVRFVGDSGAYASVGAKVLERCVGHATSAYHVPVVESEAIAAYTNNVPCGAMRGFGVNQATYGFESLVDELCKKGGFDRWKIRYDNAMTDGSLTATGQVLNGGVGLRETLLAVKDEFYKHKFVGIACGIKNTGAGNGLLENSKVRIYIAAPDNVIADHGWTEMGQGVHNVVLQTICNETHISPNIIDVRVDTKYEQSAGMTTASRATSLVGNAAIAACRQLKEDLKTHSLSQLVGREYFGEWGVDWTTKPGHENGKAPRTHFSYSYATQLVILDDDGQISKVVAAHDAGKIFNPTLFEGQLEGSIHMGLGYAISEELVMENGRPKSTMLRKCGILRAKEMPEVEVIGVECPDPYGPYGAKGVGEIGLVPTAGAVGNALALYDGERRTVLPMKLPKKTKPQPSKAKV
jgi:selenium-dependent xanthine dehydrogenase